MISVRRIWEQAAVASNDRAVANARAAATECSRRLVERAEVEAYLAEASGAGAATAAVPVVEAAPEAVATGR